MSATIQGVTLGIALFGALLGILNTWNAFDERRVKLRVRSSNLLSEQKKPFGYSIEVINLSTFPVILSEVGFVIGPHFFGVPKRLAIFPRGQAQISLPVRIEPRSEATVHISTELMPASSNNLSAAYAKTACGIVKKGRFPPLERSVTTLVSG